MDEDRIVRMSLLVLAALLDAMTQACLLIHVHLYPPSATHSKDEWLLLGTVALVPLLSSYSSPWSPLSFSSVLTLAFACLHRAWCSPSDQYTHGRGAAFVVVWRRKVRVLEVTLLAVS